MSAYGHIGKVLEKIRAASVPDRFTQDFLATKLGLSGGGARPVIPYLKRAGFLAPDGAPTQLYRQFRNPVASRAAAAVAVRNAYPALYELNEYVHEASDRDVKGLIVQITGLEPESTTVKAMLASFKALRSFADFDANPVAEAEDQGIDQVNRGSDVPIVNSNSGPVHLPATQLRLGYEINLHLPNTTDVAVFNAIFKSLREHLLA
ncbi:DUF5343 domain-containing protein [Micromonospora sp. NPDC049049]|uniref:DUF5343 domain-containing protein n=1 Tax=Micromonospora sp. NPDC049049 TaxID=3155495 RepID=UPI0033FA8C72